MKITNSELAALLTNLLTNPNSGEMSTMGCFTQFMSDLADVVCNHCGGLVVADADAAYIGMTNDDEFGDAYVLEVEPNESSPEGGGIWARSKDMEVFSGHFDYEGMDLRGEFQVPVGATTAQKDAAFMAVLAQQADIDYLSIGKIEGKPPVGS